MIIIICFSFYYLLIWCDFHTKLSSLTWNRFYLATVYYSFDMVHYSVFSKHTFRNSSYELGRFWGDNLYLLSVLKFCWFDLQKRKKKSSCEALFNGTPFHYAFSMVNLWWASHFFSNSNFPIILGSIFRTSFKFSFVPQGYMLNFIIIINNGEFLLWSKGN